MDPILAAALMAAAFVAGNKIPTRRSSVPAPTPTEIVGAALSARLDQLDTKIDGVRDDWRDALKLEIEDQMIWRQGVADRLAEEGAELELTLQSQYEEVRAWRRDEVEPRLQSFDEAAQVIAGVQQQVAALTESVQGLQPWSVEVANRVEASGGAVVEVSRRLQRLEETVETIEALIASAPPRQPATPMGPTPPGAGGLNDELAELLRRQQSLQQQFAARGARPVPANGQAQPSLRPPL